VVHPKPETEAEIETDTGFPDVETSNPKCEP